MEIRFDDQGLVPCVMQDAGTGEVLTLAYMNEEALERTRATGEMHFWSRSRQQLWRKGETSGNTMRVRALRYDCDEDALVALVDPAGPACHTGERTCFYRGDMEPQQSEALPTLQRTIEERRSADPLTSYTARLLNEPTLLRSKVTEEAEEVAKAAQNESNERLASEAADVLYHLSVLMASRDMTLRDAFDELNRRAE